LSTASFSPGCSGAGYDKVVVRVSFGAFRFIRRFSHQFAKNGFNQALISWISNQPVGIYRTRVFTLKFDNRHWRATKKNNRYRTPGMHVAPTIRQDPRHILCLKGASIISEDGSARGCPLLKPTPNSAENHAVVQPGCWRVAGTGTVAGRHRASAVAHQRSLQNVNYGAQARKAKPMGNQGMFNWDSAKLVFSWQRKSIGTWCADDAGIARQNIKRWPSEKPHALKEQSNRWKTITLRTFMGWTDGFKCNRKLKNRRLGR
jgi:hypothetical protein